MGLTISGVWCMHQEEERILLNEYMDVHCNIHKYSVCTDGCNDNVLFEY